MRFSTVAVTVLGAVASASASSLVRRQFPACATTCLTTADFGTCSPTDNVCLCNSPAFIASTTTCITSSCTGDDLTSAIAGAQALCAAVGVTLTGSPTGSASAPSATATSPAASSGASSAASSRPASSASASASGAASASSSKASAASSAAPATSSTATSGASSNGVNAIAGMAAFGLVALAL